MINKSFLKPYVKNMRKSGTKKAISIKSTFVFFPSLNILASPLEITKIGLLIGFGSLNLKSMQRIDDMVTLKRT